MTVTTADARLAARMERYAPPPERRITALAESARRGFRTICRTDPIVPGVNDNAGSLARLAAMLRDAGVSQVVSSTFKKRWDSARRFAELFPQASAASESMYDAAMIQGYRYLKADVRRSLMESVRHIVHECGLTFSCCREGFADLNDGCCDGRLSPNDRS